MAWTQERRCAKVLLKPLCASFQLWIVPKTSHREDWMDSECKIMDYSQTAAEPYAKSWYQTVGLELGGNLKYHFDVRHASPEPSGLFTLPVGTSADGLILIPYCITNMSPRDSKHHLLILPRQHRCCAGSTPSALWSPTTTALVDHVPLESRTHSSLQPSASRILASLHAAFHICCLRRAEFVRLS